MLAERGDGEALPLPESIQGIIGARLDALSPDEKRLLQDAAVIGKVFWPGAVAGARQRAPIDERLHALERKQFIRRERRSAMAGETQYAFLHLLLRDVAYGQIPRASRIEKHAPTRAVDRRRTAGLRTRRDACAPLHERARLRENGGAATPFWWSGSRLAPTGGRPSCITCGLFGWGSMVSGRARPGVPESHEDATLLLRLGRSRFSADSTGADELRARYTRSWRSLTARVPPRAALASMIA